MRVSASAMSGRRLAWCLALALVVVDDVLAVMRTFDFVISWEQGAPDGVSRELFMINGQFPGPVIEVNQGDDVVVQVQNDTPFNTTIHHHGVEMIDTPWSDGTPGLSQYHISPGCGFTYRWSATQHGSYFYHSHSTSQISDGLYGPIIIHPAPDTPTPYSLIPDASVGEIQEAEAARIPLVLSDWSHRTSAEDWSIASQSKVENLCLDSYLINGKGNVNCIPASQQPGLLTPAQAAILKTMPNVKLTDKSCMPPEVLVALLAQPGYPTDVDVIPHDVFNGCTPTEGHTEVINIEQTPLGTSKWVMFDLVGAMSLFTVQFSIDETPLWVIAADGAFIEPVQADSIQVTNGQRYTVVANFVKPKKYTMRMACVSDPQILYGTAIVDYNVLGEAQCPEPSTPYINERGVALSDSVRFFDETSTRPFQAGQQMTMPMMPRSADATYKMTMKVDDYPYLWAYNQTARMADMADDATTPLLLAPRPGGVQDMHTITNPAGAWVDYIMTVEGAQPPHPVHVHGGHFYVIGSGQGEFTWADVDEAVREVPESFNLVDPPLRDTFPTPHALPTKGGSGPPGSVWLAIRRRSDNPGVWLMHCHIQSHLRGGMSMVIQDGVDQLPEIPQEYRDQRCGGV